MLAPEFRCGFVGGLGLGNFEEDLFRISDITENLRYGKAERAVEFLKLLDDPPERRKQILFVTHGAMSRGLSDEWVKLALIYQALHGRWGVDRLRKALSRILGKLLRITWVEKNGKGIWQDLLKTHPAQWLQVLHRWGIDPERDDNPDTDDDPVPRAVCESLRHLNTNSIWECLQKIPVRQSKSFDQRVKEARHAITAEIRFLWKECVGLLRIRLPLLILDEAHHLKNPKTQLASLFQIPDAHDDAEEITRGPLGGVFERMLFLTATPFQLGHGELCSVLERFSGISWEGELAPKRGRKGYSQRLENLREALDAAQEASVTLDTYWGQLSCEDLVANGRSFTDVREWWQAVQNSVNLTPEAQQVLQAYSRAHEKMKTAEQHLQPWVIRHRKPRYLPKPHDAVGRRRRLVGQAILESETVETEDGIAVAGDVVLPFLFAARATSHAPDSRPVFAEGLASSYEAFLHTRMMNRKKETGQTFQLTDQDDDQIEQSEITDAICWYLDRLEDLLSRGDVRGSVSHPKVSATIRRVVDLWRNGEKVVLFCHYVTTGRMLRQRLSEAINNEIQQLGANKLGCPPSEVSAELARIGERFLDRDSPIRRACDQNVSELIEGFPPLRRHKEALTRIIRRYVRTPSFLVRFFQLGQERLTSDSMNEAMDKPDQSGLTLRHLLRDFFKFLVERCGERDRQRYIDALTQIQTGTYRGAEALQAFTTDELQGDTAERLVPNVRLVNGSTKSETRQKLMLAFNTPFYPEILIASSVMAEGVDLHLNCRYVIHHDLCWNPSTLEQRTGRVDRIGAKVERCKSPSPITVYMPYIAKTQDEKMYRVVMDRERWFSVVMGEKYKVDAKTTEKLANRIPFPESAAKELAFRLDI